ncbi:MAG: hypothetical protein Q9165_004443 [Trypethelium subeluteriae]
MLVKEKLISAEDGAFPGKVLCRSLKRKRESTHQPKLHLFHLDTRPSSALAKQFPSRTFASNGSISQIFRPFSTSPSTSLPQNPSLFSLGSSSSSGAPSSYFQRSSLPANTIIRFVPQQTAWIVERMGRYNRILQPGLAVMIPVLDRIAYVKSLKENAIEIPSQSAITADNVTLELDGVLYTRVFDAYKAR